MAAERILGLILVLVLICGEGRTYAAILENEQDQATSANENSFSIQIPLGGGNVIQTDTNVSPERRLSLEDFFLNGNKNNDQQRQSEPVVQAPVTQFQVQQPDPNSLLLVRDAQFPNPTGGLLSRLLLARRVLRLRRIARRLTLLPRLFGLGRLGLGSVLPRSQVTNPLSLFSNRIGEPYNPRDYVFGKNEVTYKNSETDEQKQALNNDQLQQQSMGLTIGTNPYYDNLNDNSYDLDNSNIRGLDSYENEDLSKQREALNSLTPEQQLLLLQQLEKYQHQLNQLQHQLNQLDNDANQQNYQNQVTNQQLLQIQQPQQNEHNTHLRQISDVQQNQQQGQINEQQIEQIRQLQLHILREQQQQEQLQQQAQLNEPQLNQIQQHQQQILRAQQGQQEPQHQARLNEQQLEQIRELQLQILREQQQQQQLQQQTQLNEPHLDRIQQHQQQILREQQAQQEKLNEQQLEQIRQLQLQILREQQQQQRLQFQQQLNEPQIDKIQQLQQQLLKEQLQQLQLAQQAQNLNQHKNHLSNEQENNYQNHHPQQQVPQQRPQLEDTNSVGDRNEGSPYSPPLNIATSAGGSSGYRPSGNTVGVGVNVAIKPPAVDVQVTKPGASEIKPLPPLVNPLLPPPAPPKPVEQPLVPIGILPKPILNLKGRLFFGAEMGKGVGVKAGAGR